MLDYLLIRFLYLLVIMYIYFIIITFKLVHGICSVISLLFYIAGCSYLSGFKNGALV